MRSVRILFVCLGNRAGDFPGFRLPNLLNIRRMSGRRSPPFPPFPRQFDAHGDDIWRSSGIIAFAESWGPTCCNTADPRPPPHERGAAMATRNLAQGGHRVARVPPRRSFPTSPVGRKSARLRRARDPRRRQAIRPPLPRERPTALDVPRAHWGLQVPGNGEGQSLRPSPRAAP